MFSVDCGRGTVDKEMDNSVLLFGKDAGRDKDTMRKCPGKGYFTEVVCDDCRVGVEKMGGG